MARRTNWWLDGWKYETRLNQFGKSEKKLVYKGEYYRFPTERLTAVKAVFWGMYLALVAVYGLTSVFSAPTAGRIFVAPCILALIPMMYQLIGLVSLTGVRNPATYRGYRGGVVRILWTAVALTCLFGLAVAGQAVHLLRLAAARSPVTADDIWWLLGMAGCLLDSVAILVLERRIHPHMEAQPLQ